MDCVDCVDCVDCAVVFVLTGSYDSSLSFPFPCLLLLVFFFLKKKRDLGILRNSFWIPKSLSCSFPVKKHSQSLVFFSAKSRLLNQLNELLIVG